MYRKVTVFSVFTSDILRMDPVYEVKSWMVLGFLNADLSEDQVFPTKSGIAKEELDEERLGLSRLGIIAGEGMPPPIASFTGLSTKELTGIPGNIVFVEHCIFERCSHYSLFSSSSSSRMRFLSSSMDGNWS